MWWLIGNVGIKQVLPSAVNWNLKNTKKSPPRFWTMNSSLSPIFPVHVTTSMNFDLKILKWNVKVYGNGKLDWKKCTCCDIGSMKISNSNLPQSSRLSYWRWCGCERAKGPRRPTHSSSGLKDTEKSLCLHGFGLSTVRPLASLPLPSLRYRSRYRYRRYR